MVQPSSSPSVVSPLLDPPAVSLHTRPVADVPHALAPSTADSCAGWPVGVTRRAEREVAVLEVAGPLGAVVDDLDRAIQLALAERPRGVVCDLLAMPEDAGPCTVQMLATAGRHVRNWPGTPVAVACADPRFRAALSTQSRGGHLIVTASLQLALSAVLATPNPELHCLRLTLDPIAPRVSQDFIARALLGAGLGPLIPAASLVVRELVSDSTINAGSDIELSVQWSLGLLRLTVRDNSPNQTHQWYPQFVDGQGRGLSVVAALSRTFGVLPTADGGKVVWAVLNAARTKPTDQQRDAHN